jgi:hypothetical protein
MGIRGATWATQVTEEPNHAYFLVAQRCLRFIEKSEGCGVRGVTKTVRGWNEHNHPFRDDSAGAADCQ